MGLTSVLEGGGCSTNAWNQKVSGANAGNQNNDNKTNANSNIGVRPVRRLTAPMTGTSATGTEITTAEVLRAYLDCRKHKRAKDTTTYFELDLVENITRLTRELRSEAWQPGISMCFAVTYPKPREIWAAQFYDRVAHHVIYNRLRPRLEPKFLATSFACIPGRGTLAAKVWAERAARRVTAGWTREAWALSLDVQSFFTSIDQRILLDLIAPSVHEQWLWTANQRVYTHRVTENVHFPGDPELLKAVPPHKSLWHASPGKGLPIGNLTSQFGANVYLNVVDQLISHELRPRFYGRYVDDLLFFDPDKGKLLAIRDAVTEHLHERLQLTIHPGKTHLQPVHRGIDFVGYRILPHRTYLRRRTAAKARESIKVAPDLESLIATTNSYLGISGHADTWNLRGRIVADAANRAGASILAAPDRSKVMRRNPVPRLYHQTTENGP